MIQRIRSIIKKEFKQVVRDKRTLGILLVIPSFMLIMFGYALNFDVRHTSLAYYDEDKSKESREFIQNFFRSEYFDLKFVLNDKESIDRLMGEERCRVAIVIPRNFSADLAAHNEASVQVIIDGANSNAAATVVGYVAAITQNYSTKILLKTISAVTNTEFSLPVDYRPRVWYNPELRSAKFLIPGLIAFILMITGVISTSLSVVREKEKNTLEQITVSPSRPLELIVGKTVPYIIISILAASIILAVGYILFDITVKGSYMLLFTTTLIFLTGCLGMGLLISTIAETQQIAFMISIIMTMLPTFLLSGFVFPIRNMPIVIQIITYIIPARYYLVILRSIILKGVGVEAFYLEIFFLIIFAAAMIALSAVRMKKKSW